MARLTEIAHTDGRITYGGSGWSTLSSPGTANAGNDYVAGTAHQTSTPGDYFELTVTGDALWLNTDFGSQGGSYDVTLDGVAYGTQRNNISTAVFMNPRHLDPLYRKESDSSRTVRCTLAHGKLTVDTLWLFSGAKPDVSRGTYVAMGDSITAGTGTSVSETTGSQLYAKRVALLLQTALGRPITLVNNAVGGERWVGKSALASDSNNAGRYGIKYRLKLDAYANTPEFLSLNAGVNDLVNGGGFNPGETGRFTTEALALCEDMFQVGAMSIAVCQPPLVLPLIGAHLPPTVAAPDPHDAYLMYIDNLPNLVAQFGWASCAYVYEAMARWPSSVYPNLGNTTTTDFGLHTNDIGNGVIAMEIFRALMEGRAIPV